MDSFCIFEHDIRPRRRMKNDVKEGDDIDVSIIDGIKLQESLAF